MRCPSKIKSFHQRLRKQKSNPKRQKSGLCDNSDGEHSQPEKQVKALASRKCKSRDYIGTTHDRKKLVNISDVKVVARDSQDPDFKAATRLLKHLERHRKYLKTNKSKEKNSGFPCPFCGKSARSYGVPYKPYTFRRHVLNLCRGVTADRATCRLLHRLGRR